MESMSSGLRAELAALRKTIDGDIGSLRAEMKSDLAAFRESSERHFAWLVGLMVGGFIAVIAAVIQIAR
jgi:hypothetical protein